MDDQIRELLAPDIRAAQDFQQKIEAERQRLYERYCVGWPRCPLWFRIARGVKRWARRMMGAE